MLSRTGFIAWNARALALSTTVLLGSTLASGETAMTTVKALAAAPLRYANQPVTVTGRFRGRQPAGWDFDLDPRSAADASRGPWLEVTGTFRVERRSGAAPRLWIEASD